MANQLKSVKLLGAVGTDGSGTFKATHSILGWLVAVQWIDGTFADGVDAVLSVTDTPAGVDTTLLTLTNANSDAWYYPTVTEHDNAGTARTATTLQLLEGTPQLAVTSGGTSTTGGCIIYYTDR